MKERACQKPLPVLRLSFMKPFLLSTGQMLKSVSMRYAHTRSVALPKHLRSGGKSPLKTPVGLFFNHLKVVSSPTVKGISQLEALLFLSRQPQSSRKLAQLTCLADGTKARTLVRLLNRRYDAEGNAFRVEEVAGGFQMMTRPKFAPWLRRLHAAPTEVRLSAPAMETLAVVAYRQPVLRAEIEAIRGVQSGEVLRQLIERDLVRIAGRSDELGRPFLYGTTKHFLQLFGLRHLEELPNQSLQFQVVQEENNVKTFIAKPRQVLVENQAATAAKPRPHDQSGSLGVFDVHEDDEEKEDDDEDLEDDDDLDDAEDFDDDDDEDEDEDEDEEDLDEDLDDEPWEEVEDDDEEDEDDDDDDWDDDDWDDEDEDDWDDDEDEDEDEDEEEDKEV